MGRTISEQAAGWVVLLKTLVRAEQAVPDKIIEPFFRWLDADPRHRLTYLRFEEVAEWARLRGAAAHWRIVGRPAEDTPPRREDDK